MKQYICGKDDINNLYRMLETRSSAERGDVVETVRDILMDVKLRGDAALVAYTEKFDCVRIAPEAFEIDRSELAAAAEELDPALKETILKSMANIRRFHERQRQNSWMVTETDGTLLGQKVTPMDRVGVYAPAGTAPLPSTALMDIVPAKVAGVGEIILCSPPGADGKVNPMVMACAYLAGADRVFSVGGSQAIAAMAYGTASIPRVDKIVGPGNIYVATAKKLVYGVCGIDMVAGPSEVLVLADKTANPAYAAADMLSQAEHDVLASAILITDSMTFAEAVKKELAIQLTQLSRGNIASISINDYGAIVVASTMDEAVAIVNRVAPEHLEILTENPFGLLGSIRHAGAIFLGEWSPEPLGDYFAGPNHTLPTNGTARFFSPLSVDDFVKKSSIISYGKQAFLNAADDIARFADAEGLTAHARSARIRKEGV